MNDRHQPLRVERASHVVRAVIDTPVIDRSLASRLGRVLDDLAREKPPLPVVLCGAHPTVFLAGADLAEIADLDASTSIAYAGRGRRIVRRLDRHPAPVVAAVHGACTGGGFDLVMACDAIVAHPKATFRHPGIHRGLVTGWTGTTVLPHALGGAGARQVFLEGRAHDAATMQGLGLVVAVAEQTLGAATTLARRLGALEWRRLELWRALRGPRFVDRFRAIVLHKL